MIMIITVINITGKNKRNQEGKEEKDRVKERRKERKKERRKERKKENSVVFYNASHVTK